MFFVYNLTLPDQIPGARHLRRFINFYVHVHIVHLYNKLLHPWREVNVN